jgi:hypothetical protein
MTATEMGYEFDVSYDKITNFDNPGYEPKEKSLFLTKAQEELVLELQGTSSYSEMNKRLIDVLKTTAVVLAAAMTEGDGNIDGAYANSWYVELPNVVSDNVTRAFKVINERATLTSTSSHFYASTEFTNVRVKPIDDDYYHMNINNPHKKPDHELVWRMDYGQLDISATPDTWAHTLVYIVEDNQVLTSVQIHYYRKPTPIVIPDSDYAAGDTIDGVDLNVALYQSGVGATSELNKMIHRKIVDRAVKLAYKALQDEKGVQLSSV